MPPIALVRHGDTEWSAAHRHTGRTDVPLNAAGIAATAALSQRLPSGPYDRIWTSPSSRARDTARLAGFPGALVVPDLAEWDYGEFEGVTTRAIQADRPGWNLFRDGCPNGEDVAAATARADRIVAALLEEPVPTLLFSSSHFLRLLAARWADWPAAAGAGLALDTASISILGTEHDGADRVIRQWNLVATGRQPRARQQ